MPDRFEIAVVGSFGDRQKLLRWLYEHQERKAKIAAALLREPHNRHDPNANAIAVLVGADIGDPEGPDYGPDHVGYIPKPLAAILAPRMDAGAEVAVTGVRINRDWGRGYPQHVVKLTLEVREPLAAPVLTEEERGGF